MERVFAFTDEYGAFGWDLDNPSVSTHFIVTAIIVKESDLDTMRAQAENVRKKHFQTGEMKSSKVGQKHDRRRRILVDLLSLPFSIFSVVIAKKDVYEWEGLQHKSSFYKFINNIVHKELRRAYTKRTIVADEIGSNEYMQSFSAYVAKRQDVQDLFGEADFQFMDSSNDVVLQVADFISGTLGCEFDYHKRSQETPDYRRMIAKKITRIEIYPKTYENYVLDNSALADDYSKAVAEICFNQAARYIEGHKDSDDIEVQARVATTQYLLFRFMNNNLRGYISTQELKNQLAATDMGVVSTHAFRTKIIGKLRDDGAVIASSPRGYKIPSTEAELYDFINHGTTIIVPMLERLKKCRDIIKLGTVNELDLFDNSEYKTLKDFFDKA